MNWRADRQHADRGDEAADVHRHAGAGGADFDRKQLRQIQRQPAEEQRGHETLRKHDRQERRLRAARSAEHGPGERGRAEADQEVRESPADPGRERRAEEAADRRRRWPTTIASSTCSRRASSPPTWSAQGIIHLLPAQAPTSGTEASRMPISVGRSKSPRNSVVAAAPAFLPDRARRAIWAIRAAARARARRARPARPPA